MQPSVYLNGLGHQSSSPSSAASSANDLDFAILSKRHEHFMLFEQERAKFMSELIVKYEYLHQKYQAVVGERDRQREWMMAWQLEKQQYEQWIKNMQQALVVLPFHAESIPWCSAISNPFVVLLIDGNSMIFNDEFLRQGELGGRQAASRLHVTVLEYIQDELENVPHGARVVCRIHANVRGLGDMLVCNGIVHDTTQFEDFVRGFNQGKTLFDFVDVGTDQNRADEKVIESLKLFSDDHQCRQILIGCSYHNGSAKVLEEYSAKGELLDKLVILKGVSSGKEMSSLLYHTKTFPGLFRDSNLIPWVGSGDFITSKVSTQLTSTTPPNFKTFNMFPGLPTRFPASTRISTTQLMDSPPPALASLTNFPRTPSSSTLASDGMTASRPAPSAESWAAKAAAPAPLVPDSPSYRPATREEVIARNRAGQRVDPPSKDYDKSEVDRIKKMKLCNVHFLRDECPYGTSCTHLHAYQPTRDEISTLRLVARMAPCQNGSSCQDMKCIYGHRCPAPPNKTHAVKGTKSCIFGELCKFPPELHDLDTNVVKTLVIR